jgi:DNA-directed RNA polymerase specialized sigma24 family protein
MARDSGIEERLQRWADWLNVGDGSGYPVTSVLHPHWQPPSPGITPTMKVSSFNDARQTHRAVGRLSRRLSNTLVVHYCLKLPLTEQARRLECSEQTVVARVELAHRRLLAEFCNKLEVA